MFALQITLETFLFVRPNHPTRWVFLTHTCSVKCFVVGAVGDGKGLSSLVESELCCEPWHWCRGGQSSAEAWEGLWRSELETGGSADSGSQIHWPSEGSAR